MFIFMSRFLLTSNFIANDKLYILKFARWCVCTFCKSNKNGSNHLKKIDCKSRYKKKIYHFPIEYYAKQSITSHKMYCSQNPQTAQSSL